MFEIINREVFENRGWCLGSNINNLAKLAELKFICHIKTEELKNIKISSMMTFKYLFLSYKFYGKTLKHFINLTFCNENKWGVK